MRIAPLLAALVTAPSVGGAYVVRRTDSGIAVRWTSPPTVWADETLDELTGSPEASRGVVTNAVDAWAGVPEADLEDMGTGSCTGGAPGYDAAHPEDNRSAVFAVRELPGDDPDALAVTLVTFDVATAEILDADILVRSRGIHFALDGDPHAWDLESVVTHEIGHLLGLLHEDEIEEATMYPGTREGDTGKRTLSWDDEAGIRSVYGVLAVESPETTPGAPSPGTACRAVPGGGRGPAAPGAIVALAIGIAWTRRARRERFFHDED